MELLRHGGIELPDNLQVADYAMTRVIKNAHDMQNDINSSSLPPQKKHEQLGRAVAELNRQAQASFMHEQVIIEGTYYYPKPGDGRNGILLQLVPEIGIRQGISQGFFRNMIYQADEKNEMIPETVEARLEYGVFGGELSIANKCAELTGTFNFLAPISESSLTLSAIENYKNQVLARSLVTQTKRDKYWSNTISHSLINTEGPDLRALGTILSRLQSLRGDRIEDYLTYINSMLLNSSRSADLLCDHAFVYQVGDKLPTVVRQEDVIGGSEATICFADDFNFDDNGSITAQFPKLSPTLSLNVEIVGRSGSVVLHAPLSAIQCIDFK